MSLRRPHIVDKVVMVHPLAFPLKSTFERVNGDLEALIEASWEPIPAEVASPTPLTMKAVQIVARPITRPQGVLCKTENVSRAARMARLAHPA